MLEKTMHIYLLIKG